MMMEMETKRTINQLSNALKKDGFEGHVELKENGFIIVQGSLKKGIVYSFYAQTVDLCMINLITITNNIVKIFTTLNDNGTGLVTDVDKNIINNILKDMAIITFQNPVMFSQEYIEEFELLK